MPARKLIQRIKTMLDNRLGSFLQQERARRDWKQQDLARRLGITQQTLSKWENGKIVPRVKSARKIADVFNLPVEEVLALYRGGKNNLSLSEDDTHDQVLSHLFGKTMRAVEERIEAERRLRDFSEQFSSAFRTYVEELFTLQGYALFEVPDEETDIRHALPIVIAQRDGVEIHALISSRPSLDQRFSFSRTEPNAGQHDTFRLTVPLLTGVEDAEKETPRRTLLGAPRIVDRLPDLLAVPVPIEDRLHCAFVNYDVAVSSARSRAAGAVFIPLLIREGRAILAGEDVTERLDTLPSASA